MGYFDEFIPTVKDTVKGYATGVAQNMTGMLGLGGDLRNLVGKGFDALGAPPRQPSWADKFAPPSSAEINKAVGIDYQPHTMPGGAAQLAGSILGLPAPGVIRAFNSQYETFLANHAFQPDSITRAMLKDMASAAPGNKQLADAVSILEGKNLSGLDYRRMRRLLGGEEMAPARKILDSAFEDVLPELGGAIGDVHRDHAIFKALEDKGLSGAR